MRKLLFLAFFPTILAACSKDNEIETAYTAKIIDKPSSVSIGDPEFIAVLAVDQNNDTLLLANIPFDFKEGRQIRFNIRPLRAGDPVVVVALSPILPKEKFVKDLR